MAVIPLSQGSKVAIFFRLMRGLPLDRYFTFREMSKKVEKESGYPFSAKEFDVLIYALRKRGWTITCGLRMFQNPPRVEVFYKVLSRPPSP